MGRRARPVEVLVLKGKKHLTKREVRERQEQEAALRPAADAIKPPSWLDAAARRVWRRAVAALEPLQIVTNADLDQLALYCDAVARYADCTKLIRKQGLLVPGATGGLVQNPAVLAASKYAGIIARIGSKFGLDPSGRASLAIPRDDKKKPRDRFEELFGS